MTKTSIVATLLLVGVASSAAIAAPCGSPTMPAGAKPYSKAELTAAFSGKTWSWGADGGSYWAPDGSFVGISISHKSIGKGSWTADDAGKLCYTADWTSPKGKSPFGLCWAYVKTDKASFDSDMQGADKGKWHCSDAKFKGKLGQLKDGDQITPQLDGLSKKWKLN